jgi:hypothetical protein
MRAPQRRAFTLLELVIGTTISLGIAGVAMSLLLMTQSTQRETQLKNAVTRDTMYVLDMLGGDLGYAGVGVPFGDDIDGFAGRMRPVVRRADATALAFIGDLPLPNADENGLAVVADVNAAGTSVAVVSDVSLCAPAAAAGAYDCDSTANSLVNLGPIAGSDECNASRMGARSCPWGLGKWQRDDDDLMHVVIGAADGRYVQRSINLSGGQPAPSTVNDVVGVPLTGGPITRNTFVRQRVGASTVSTIDRVFYSLETLSGAPCIAPATNCVLLRRHCWGEVFDPAAEGFPSVGTAPLTSAITPAGCVAPSGGTRWEPVTTAIDRLTFRYYDRAGIELAVPLATTALQNVAAVEIDIVISRLIPLTDRRLTHRMTRRWFLDAGDGFGERGRQ